MDRLFVYGSLQPGASNAHVLAGLDGAWQPATVRGHLFEVGWGAGMGFPGLVLDPRGADVPGQLFTSADLQGAWARLDAFEGDEYQRTLAEVTLASGACVNAWLYAVRHPDATRR